MYWDYKPYVSVAARRANAVREMDKHRKKGRTITPIEKIQGRKIATTFWGKAWCDHIECLSDFESRLDRGKTYIRNGSVCHLEIKKGRVEAFVCGSELYEISIDIDPLDAKTWKAIKAKCGGQIGTMVELLQGKFSNEVMAVLTDPKTGMFPHANDFRLDCDCPDFARLCKHLAAVLYGVGVRLDREPELLFTLRGVDHMELLETAMKAGAPASPSATDAALGAAELSDVFGIDLAPEAAPKMAKPPKAKPTAAKKPAKKTSVAKKTKARKSR